MKVTVINLPQRIDRKEAFLRWNGQQPLPFQFVTAIQGESLDRAELVRSSLLSPADTSFEASALGSALSHLALWQACAKGQEPFLVLEDGACLRADFWKHAKPILETYISAHDAIIFGYDPDQGLAVRGADGVVSAFRFVEASPRRADYFDVYCKIHDVRPNLFQCLQFWGTLAYAVSPSGARRLIETCFPLSSKEPVERIGVDPALMPAGLDSMINLGLQKHRLDILACYPPLASGSPRLPSFAMPVKGAP